MSDKPTTEDAWERVAEEAAAQFLRSGYAAVSLRKLAQALGMKAASLYYHCPEGKAELYFRSLHHVLEGYRAALDAVAMGAPFPENVFNMADWMLEHPPVDFRRIMEVDVPALEKAGSAYAEQVPMLLHSAVFEPVRDVLLAGQQQRAVDPDADVNLAAASIIALVQGLGYMHAPKGSGALDPTTVSLVRGGLALLVRGLSPSVNAR